MVTILTVYRLASVPGKLLANIIRTEVSNLDKVPTTVGERILFALMEEQDRGRIVEIALQLRWQLAREHIEWDDTHEVWCI